MKLAYFGVAALAASLLAGSAQAATPVTGDYVESRSANVYVGACHHEGEIQTAGRNAVLAWKIAQGEYDGVNLSGVSAVAVVSANKHLEFADARRRSVIYVSDAATPEQRTAVADLLKARAASALGEVLAVKVAPISFSDADGLYQVRVADTASLKVKKQTGELCCKQPYQLWGKPFVSVKDSKAGYCLGVQFKDDTLLQSWSATEQNNAYFGHFEL